MKTLVSFTLSVICIPLLAGCANPYSQFYRPISLNPGPRIDKGAPELFTPANILGKVAEMKNDGYAVLGVSSFFGGSSTLDPMLQQANNVGASAIVYDTQYSHTEQGVAPMLQYTPGQTVTTESRGYVYGMGGSAYYNGTAETQIPGSYSTTYIPYSRAVYDHEAVFLRKVRAVDQKQIEARSRLQDWTEHKRNVDPGLGDFTEADNPQHGQSTADKVRDGVQAYIKKHPDAEPVSLVSVAENIWQADYNKRNGIAGRGDDVLEPGTHTNVFDSIPVK